MRKAKPKLFCPAEKLVHFIDRYIDWLLNLLGLILVVLAMAPLWPWPFNLWPFGALGGLMMFLWIAMLAMDWIERKTGYYWSVKLGALILLGFIASLINP